jgi:GT2 family glycosyltransferase
MISNPDSVAAGIVQAFHPASVLVLGEGGGGLPAALSALGVEASACASPAASPETCFDLIAGTLDGAPDCRAAAAQLASRTSRLLLESPEAPLEWLRSFADLGFSPDLAFDGTFFSPSAMLLAKTGAPVSGEVLALFAEMVRLRRRLARAEAARAGDMDQVRADVAALLALLERQRLFLDRLDSHVSRQRGLIEDIMQSRIWRTLCAGGARVLRAADMGRSAARLLKGCATALRRDTFRLRVEEPAAGARVGGRIRVRGWAFDAAGVERVEAALDDGKPVEARLGLPSPEAAFAFPRHPAAANAGFELEIGGLAAIAETHRLRVRAVSRSGAVRDSFRLLDRRLTAYDRWIAEFEQPDSLMVRLRLGAFALRPLISILMPVYRPAAEDLERAIASVLWQSYRNWELCVVDDASGSSEVSAVLARTAASDARIRVAARDARGGISAASNTALALARGSYVALLDHDDELAPDALFHVVDALNRNPGAAFVYSDEDKIDAAGDRYEPFFKPDWSPDLLLSENYICHFLVARRDLVEWTGGFRSEYDGAQDYDLVLRLAECEGGAIHVPKVLYHWRATAGSAALEAEAKPQAAEAARLAVEDRLRRRAIGAVAEPGLWPGRVRVRYAIHNSPRVGILIPSGGDVSALRSCLESLCTRTAYGDFEMLVADNSRHGRVERVVRSWRHNARTVRYLDWRRKPFNFSAICNAAVRECDAPLLLFLNDDIEAIAPEWLEAMVEHAVRPEVGAVGAKLVYPDGRIQHAGVLLDVFECGGHAFRGLPANQRHYFDFPDVIRNVSAVTAASMLVRRSVFEEAGGFDETRFPVSFNDVDFCLRLGRLGYRTLYTPHAVLCHRESLSRRRRGMILDPTGAASMRAFWKDAIAEDPFYNPNLTRTAEDYSLRRRLTASGV